MFQALVNWSAVQCKRDRLNITASNQRCVLTGLLEFIRFGAMSYDEFMDGPAKSCLLTDSEIETLESYFRNGTEIAKHGVLGEMVNQPRLGLETLVCNRYEKYRPPNYRWSYRGQND